MKSSSREHHRFLKLSFAQKEQFFHELTQSLRSGRSLPETLERKAGKRFGAMPKLARRMIDGAGEGSAAEFFGAVPEAFSDLDREMVAAGAAGGRLDSVTGYLSNYYETLDRTRRRIITGLLYPFVLLHVAALLLAVPEAVNGGGEAFIVSVASVLGVFYAILIAVCILVTIVNRAVRRNAAVDRLIMRIPIIGEAPGSPRGVAFLSDDEHPRAIGGGILRSMERAGAVCESAVYREGADEAAAAVRNGEPLGEAVEDCEAFPDLVTRAFETGEQSGRLDDEMERLSNRYDEQLKDRLNALSAWLPTIVYLGIALYIGWRIIDFYVGYFGQINRLLEGV